MALKIEVTREFDALRIFIGGILHLHVKRSDLLGIQSWVRQPESRWFIEYTLRGGNVTCDYDSEEKWKSILEQIAEQL